MSNETVIAEIVELWRRRQDAVRGRTRIELQAQAILRRVACAEMGIRSIIDADDKTKTKVRAAAAKMWAQARSGQAFEHVGMVTPFIKAIAPLTARQEEMDKALAVLVRRLPIHAYAKTVSGLGDVSLAGLIGECGESMANYKSVAAVWKRLGLAVLDGKRQGNPGKDATADDWKAHGYSGRRRSVVWNIGECIVKAQWRGEKADKETGEIVREAHAIGDLGAYYAAEKQRQLDKGLSKLHANNRAKRHMTKRMIVGLYAEWKRIERGSQVELAQAA